jgi:hypothetical protein
VGSARGRVGPRTPSSVAETLTLRILGCGVRVRCEDAEIHGLLHTAYGAMERPVGEPQLSYTVGRCAPSAGFFVHRAGQASVLAATEAELLFQFETDLSIELQKLRDDLYFLHGAALELRGHAVLLVAASGGGKSTATWGLVHHGFRYLSDELAPVDPRTVEVHAYPRALCLKARPPAPYPLPAATLRTPQALHVPAADLAGGLGHARLPVVAVFFVSHRAGALRPRVEPMSRAEAAARLLAHALNPLAHPGSGLDAATAIAGAAASFRLSTASLPVTAAVVKATLGQLPALRTADPTPAGTLLSAAH